VNSFKPVLKQRPDQKQYNHIRELVIVTEVSLVWWWTFNGGIINVRRTLSSGILSQQYQLKMSLIDTANESIPEGNVLQTLIVSYEEAD
jgi:hypothetical protein